MILSYSDLTGAFISFVIFFWDILHSGSNCVFLKNLFDNSFCSFAGWADVYSRLLVQMKSEWVGWGRDLLYYRYFNCIYIHRSDGGILHHVLLWYLRECCTFHLLPSLGVSKCI